MPSFVLAAHDALDHATVPVAVAVMGALLVYATWTLRGLLKQVRAELEQARAERDQARNAEDALRLEVGRLRRVVSALIRVVADAGLPVPDEARDEVGL